MHFNIEIVDVIVIIVLHVQSPVAFRNRNIGAVRQELFTKENLDRYPSKTLSFRLLPAGHSGGAD
jgi:hypothetical protein